VVFNFAGGNREQRKQHLSENGNSAVCDKCEIQENNANDDDDDDNKIWEKRCFRLNIRIEELKVAWVHKY